jgi:hypothetical protein
LFAIPKKSSTGLIIIIIIISSSTTTITYLGGDVMEDRPVFFQTNRIVVASNIALHCFHDSFNGGFDKFCLEKQKRNEKQQAS